MNGGEAVAFAHSVGKFWNRRGVLARDLEDVRQEAVLSVLEVERARGIPLRKAAGYHRTIAIRRTGMAVSRAWSPATVGQKFAQGLDRHNRPLEPGARPRSAPVAALARVPGGEAPDALLEAAERERARQELTWRVKLAVARLSADEKAEVAAIMGGGEVDPGARDRMRRPDLLALWQTAQTGEGSACAKYRSPGGRAR